MSDLQAWWSGQRTLLSQQPVAHAIGGALWGAFGLALWWPAGGWRPILFAAGMTFYWQLRVWEPTPDGTYPFLWAVLDTLVAAGAASLLTLIVR